MRKRELKSAMALLRPGRTDRMQHRTPHTGNAVVLNTVRSAKLECIWATPGSLARYWREMRAKSSVPCATSSSSALPPYPFNSPLILTGPASPFSFAR